MLKIPALTFLAAFTYSSQAAMPVSSSSPEQPNPPLPLDEPGGLPRNAYQNPAAVNNPFKNLFRATSPGRFGTNSLNLSPEVRPAESLRIDSSIDLPDFRGNFPLLQRGFAPEDADLKIGPVYLKLRQLSSGVYWSDNINRSNSGKESEVNGFVSIGAQIIWQISEATRLSAYGNYVWLPWENDAGLAGFAARSPLNFGLASRLDARAQAAWEPVFFGIPWVFANDIRTNTGYFTNGIYDNFELFEGFELEGDEDENPRLIGFRNRGIQSRGQGGTGLRDGGLDFQTSDRYDEFTFFSNTISAATTTRVLGDTYFKFKASHEDLWYPDFEDRRGLPSTRNTIVAKLQSYRENLRFKPYLSYRFSEQDEPDRRFQYLRLGAKGPVTDLIQFDGNAGYSVEDKTDNKNFLWLARLNHIINPRTRHSIEWSRNILELSDEVTKRALYRFNHILGPGLNTELYAGYHWVEELEENSPDREEFRTGARITWLVSPRTNVRLWGQYTDLHNNANTLDRQSWRGRFELSHRLYDQVQTRLIYQYTELDSIRSSQSYKENLLYFTMSYLFE